MKDWWQQIFSAYVCPQSLYFDITFERYFCWILTLNWQSLKNFNNVIPLSWTTSFLWRSLWFFKIIIDLQCCANSSVHKVAYTTHTHTHTHTHTFLYTYIYIYIYMEKDTHTSFSYVNFHYGLSQEVSYSFLCFTVGPHCLSILNIIVCIY